MFKGASGWRTVAVVLGAGALAIALCVAEPAAFASGTTPGAPTDVVASPETSNRGAAYVSWTAPANDGGSAITGYVVTANPGDKQCEAKKSPCTIHNLTDGDTYTFSVRGRNANGEGAASTTVALTLGVPLSPTDVTTSNWYADDDQNIQWSDYATSQINWKAPADSGGAITQYTATSSPGSKSCKTNGQRSCSITGLKLGSSYTFTVTATNARGTGVASVRSAPPILTLAKSRNMGPYFPTSDISTDGTHLWAANWYSGSVLEFNTSDQLVRTIALGNSPYGISSDGTHVWVTNENDHSVTELDASNGSVGQTIAVGNSPYGISSDGTHVWVADSGSNTVTELDASDGSFVQTITVGASPQSLSSDGTHVWVANFDNTITELDASDGSVVQTIAVGTCPEEDSAASISSDGSHVWVADCANAVGSYPYGYAYDTVTELDASDGSVVRTIPVTYGAANMFSDGTHVWVGGGDGVTELDASTGSLVQIIETGSVNGYGVAALVSSIGDHAWAVNPSWGPITDLQDGFVTEFAG
jgi:YVTN family beta-propeller protein